MIKPNTSEAITDEPKQSFTTGEVAKMCEVAPRTVSKWFDSGQLKGWRIPGGRDRRIPREHLIQFLKDNNMPLGALGQDLLLVATNENLMLKEVMPNWTLQHARSSFEAGLSMDRNTRCVIMDYDIGYGAANQTAERLREQYQSTMIALVSDEDYYAGVSREVYSDIFRKPFDAALLRERIRTLTGL